MYFNSKIRRLVSTFFVYSGFSRYARRLHRDQPCILMFHGVREANDPGLLDAKLHVELPTFVEVCENLAANFKVIPLQQISAAIDGGEPLPSGTVALTFDDGYASNYHLGFPELKRLGLPATIFPATGFLDKTEMLWFLRVEYAVARTAVKQAVVNVGTSKHALSFGSHDERQASLGELQVALKALPQEELVATTVHIETKLDCALPAPADWPDMFQPMTWAEARAMHASGLIEFGGHTHRHFILSRCQPETVWREIHQCHARLHAELGAHRPSRSPTRTARRATTMRKRRKPCAKRASSSRSPRRRASCTHAPIPTNCRATARPFPATTRKPRSPELSRLSSSGANPPFRLPRQVWS